jgi:hypothetical protein
MTASLTSLLWTAGAASDAATGKPIPHLTEVCALFAAVSLVAGVGLAIKLGDERKPKKPRSTTPLAAKQDESDRP